MKTAFRNILGLSILLLLMFSVARAENMPEVCTQDCPAPFVKNKFWTTQYGTASANIILSSTNFLACSSKSYALCYYSGPDEKPTGKNGKKLPSLPCKTSKDDPNAADCRCYVESGNSYVDIHSIQNTEAYIETVRICGINGEKCNNMASEILAKLAIRRGRTPPTLATAPVCSYLQAASNGITAMAPKAELVSTFSFAEAKHYTRTKIDHTCIPAPYAGCMTASCTFERNQSGEQTGYANCHCPIYTGPFQIGPTDRKTCNTGPNNVWSASYSPPKNQ